MKCCVYLVPILKVWYPEFKQLDTFTEAGEYLKSEKMETCPFVFTEGTDIYAAAQKPIEFVGVRQAVHPEYVKELRVQGLMEAREPVRKEAGNSHCP